jgi:tRNA-2-methylthio-N6-dimethylallyladenosine synthase
MNEYDSDRILDIVKGIGYEPTKNIPEADCYVLNTCHIREKATDKVYHDIGRVKKEFRNKKKPILIVAGCVAQAEGEVILKKESYIDGVIGPQSYHKICDIIKNLEKKKKKINATEFDTEEKFERLNYLKSSNSKISSFLTIQEGCDKFCKFCVVPYTRGPEHSRSFIEIITEAKQLIDNGSQEITLLGQNVNAYNNNGKKLSDLINELDNLRGLKRLRYTTSHPNDVSKDLIEAHASSKKLMPLLHLPVQSGSNKILKAMNRKHSVEDYFSTIEKLKSGNKNMKFSSDFIIAYPGESEEDFNKTIFLMKKIQFINSYSFLYSQRPGTPAAEIETTSVKIAKKRLTIFQQIADKIKKNYRSSLIHSNAKVLFENRINDNRKYFGRDEYLNSFIVESDTNIVGKILDVKIVDFNHNTLFGDIINDKNIAA